MSTLINPENQIVETCTPRRCAACGAFVAVEHRERLCNVCHGFGKIWVAPSGWTRPFYSRHKVIKYYGKQGGKL